MTPRRKHCSARGAGVVRLRLGAARPHCERAALQQAHGSQMPYPAYYPQMLIPQPYSLTLDLTQIPYLQTLIPSRMTYSQDPCRFP